MAVLHSLFEGFRAVPEHQVSQVDICFLKNALEAIQIALSGVLDQRLSKSHEFEKLLRVLGLQTLDLLPNTPTLDYKRYSTYIR